MKKLRQNWGNLSPVDLPCKKVNFFSEKKNKIGQKFDRHKERNSVREAINKSKIKYLPFLTLSSPNTKQFDQNNNIIQDYYIL